MTLRLEDEDDIQVAPLSAEELAWARKLDLLLGKIPKRLKLIEVDDSLKLVDRAALLETDGGFGSVERAGAVLADLRNGFLNVSSMTF